MVAYSFKRMFVPQIVAGLKTHTVRGHRKRHAQPGEAVQLYEGMRTRYCRKLIDPDPVCQRVRRIVICTSDMLPIGIASIDIEGVPLPYDMIEVFASSDGFSPALVGGQKGMTGRSARENMGAFWLAEHGVGRFEGVLIEWDAAPSSGPAGHLLPHGAKGKAPTSLGGVPACYPSEASAPEGRKI